MAINPCEGEELFTDSTDTDGDGEVGADGGGEDNSDDTLEEQEAGKPLFAECLEHHVPDEEEESFGRPSPSARQRVPFRSAMREISTIPNALFMTEQVDIGNITETLKINMNPRDRGKRPAVHGALFFENNKLALEKADLFRWSLYAVWNSSENSEYFLQRACGPHDNIYQRSLNIGGAFYTDERFRNFDDARVLGLYRGLADNGDFPRVDENPEGIEPSRYIRLIPDPENLEEGEFVVRENMRMTLVTRSFQLNNSNVHRTAGRHFARDFIPSAIQNSDNSLREQISMFLKIYLFGNSDVENWRSFGLLNPPAGTVDYYRRGILSFNKKFDDYVFDAPVAFFEEEANNMLISPFHSAKITKKVGNVDFVNIKGYSNELEVPNIYHYYNSMQIEKKYKNRFEAGERGSFVGPLLTSQEIIRRYKSPERDNNVYATPSVLKFPSDRVERFDEINEFMKGYAENYVEIRIRTSQKGTINAFLQRNKMDRLLMEIIEPIDAPDLPAGLGELSGYPLSDNLNRPTDINTKIEEQTTLVLDDAFTEIGNEQNSIARTINDRTVSNVPNVIRDSFFKILKEDLPASNNLSFQYSNKAQYPLLYTGWENIDLLRLEEHIKSQIFVSQAENFIKQNKLQRSYADILYGQKAYSEVVGYRVEKHIIHDDETEELVQTFLLMDSNEVETINFIDSQIMPFKKYNYKIFTINLVVGTRYEYDSENTILNAPLIDLGINSQKRIYIVNAPFFQQVVETRDMPPMFPQVNFLPYQGISDRFSILLQQNYGEIEEPRVLIESGEQNYNVHFKTDSMPSAYEWFRIEHEPEEYSDFSNAATGIIPATGKTALVVQDIVPNKYYYYTFRAIDNYDFDNPDPNRIMYSNPTEVYRIRMVSYENGIFMEIDPFEMYKKVPSSKIEFERLLKITPSFEQTLVNFANSFNRVAEFEAPLPDNSITKLRKDLNLIKGKEYVADTKAFQMTAPPVEELSLGITNQKKDEIWAKKFKIRIKSKSTGKAVDLNVQFSQEKKTKPE